MKNKDTGEFELVVGNGVLLSGFFIVVLLFAVAFAMGFIVARAKYQQDPQIVAAAAAGAPLGSPVAPSRSVSADAPGQPDPSRNPPPAGDAQPPATTPVQPDPATPTAAPPPAAETVAAVTTDSSAIPKARPGLYWQVTSIADVEAARVFLQTIKDMGLPVTLSPGPNKFTRVLVGPYPDTAAMGKVKTQLEHAGMHPVRLNL